MRILLSVLSDQKTYIFNSYRFAGALDLAKLDAAFLHLLSFSNVLRTSFAREVNGKVSATLHPAPATAVLEKLEAENEEAVRRLYEQHLKAPFDLGKRM